MNLRKQEKEREEEIEILRRENEEDKIIHTYIYIYAVEFKTGPMFAFFSVKNWSIFLFLFFVCLFLKTLSPCRKKRMFKKKEEK